MQMHPPILTWQAALGEESAMKKSSGAITPFMAHDQREDVLLLLIQVFPDPLSGALQSRGQSARLGLKEIASAHRIL